MENLKLCALLSNNFGRRKNDPAKDRRVMFKIKGYKHEGNRNSKCQYRNMIIDVIAKELNVS